MSSEVKSPSPLPLPTPIYSLDDNEDAPHSANGLISTPITAEQQLERKTRKSNKTPRTPRTPRTARSPRTPRSNKSPRDQLQTAGGHRSEMVKAKKLTKLEEEFMYQQVVTKHRIAGREGPARILNKEQNSLPPLPTLLQEEGAGRPADLDKPLPVLVEVLQQALKPRSEFVEWLETQIDQLNQQSTPHIEWSLNQLYEQMLMSTQSRQSAHVLVEKIWRLAIVLMEFEKGDIETNLTHSIICLRLLNRVSSYDKVKYHFFYEATTNTLNQAFLQRERMLLDRIFKPANPNFASRLFPYDPDIFSDDELPASKETKQTTFITVEPPTIDSPTTRPETTAVLLEQTKIVEQKKGSDGKVYILDIKAANDNDDDEGDPIYEEGSPRPEGKLLEVKIDRMIESPRSEFASDYETPRSAEVTPRKEKTRDGKKHKSKDGKRKKKRTTKSRKPKVDGLEATDQIETIAVPKPVLIETENGELIQV